MIDDNPIEEDSDAENSDGSRRQKRKSRSDDELDDRLEDDDYDLLEENLGVKVQRKVNSFEWLRFSIFFSCFAPIFWSFCVYFLNVETIQASETHANRRQRRWGWGRQ